MMDKPNILVGMCGSVASVKVTEIIVGLSQFANVKLITTDRAKHFLDISKGYNPAIYEEFLKIMPESSILSDADEWNNYSAVHSDPVLHIELRKWADMLVIVPLSANTLAKLANGICDNLLTSVFRAWDFDSKGSVSKPVFVAPAMNTMMMDHPITSTHLKQLQSWNVHIIPTVEKKLACGDIGKGALAPVSDIIKVISESINEGRKSLDMSSLNAESRFMSPFVIGIVLTTFFIGVGFSSLKRV